MYRRILSSEMGLTLIELLITVVLTGVVATAIFNVYLSSSQTYTKQLAETEVQQNLRAGLESVIQDLRMAGFKGRGGATTGITNAGNNSISFTMDRNEDGDILDADEDLTYSLFASGGIMNLVRRPGAAAADMTMAVAENIDALGFAYSYDINGDGILDVNASGNTIRAVIGANGNWFNLDANDDGVIDLADDTDTNGTLNATDTGIPADLEDIRVVTIWMLARTSRSDNNFNSTTSFTIGDTVVPPAAGFRRRILTTQVYCRNMGV